MKATCAYCNKSFYAERSSRKYCSNTCRQKAYLNRHHPNKSTNRKTIVDANEVSMGINGVSLVFKWPELLSQVEYYLIYAPDLCVYKRNEWDTIEKSIVSWVNIRVKCLLNQILLLSYRKSVKHETLQLFQTVLLEFIQSEPFLHLPHDYPCQHFILDLYTYLGKILVYVPGPFPNGVKLIISFHCKAKIYGMIYAMGDQVPLKRFSELTFS